MEGLVLQVVQSVPTTSPSRFQCHELHVHFLQIHQANFPIMHIGRNRKQLEKKSDGVLNVGGMIFTLGVYSSSQVKGVVSTAIPPITTYLCNELRNFAGSFIRHIKLPAKTHPN